MLLLKLYAIDILVSVVLNTIHQIADAVKYVIIILVPVVKSVILLNVYTAKIVKVILANSVLIAIYLIANVA